VVGQGRKRESEGRDGKEVKERESNERKAREGAERNGTGK
jgi:hypothetical protein